MKDLTGQVFTWLIVEGAAPEKKNGRFAWRCRCKCGNVVDVITNSLTSGHTKSCGCYNSKGRIKDITNQRFGKLTALYPTEKRSGTAVIWHCQCDCGNECDVSVQHLGKSVFSCGCFRAECAREKGKQQIKDLTGQRFGLLTCLSLADSDGSGANWLCQCDCGNQRVVRAGSLIQGYTSSCGCLNSSKGELLLRQIFDELNIEYETEKTFSECVSIKGCALRFDFYLLKYDCCIEYDGIQHFKPTYGVEVLKLQQENDTIKNQFCIDNGLTLVRIPYIYKTKQQITDYLKQTVLTRCTLVQ